jgi:Tfp pilus assembly protein PilF
MKKLRKTLVVLAGGLFLAIATSTGFAGEPIVVRGVVVDVDGNPLAGVTVTAVADGTELETTARTNKKGRIAFRLPDDSQVYTLTFEMEGLGSSTTTFQPNPEDNRPFTVTMVPSEQALAQPPEASPLDAVPAEADKHGGKEAPGNSEARRTAATIFNEGVTALEAEDLPAALEKFKRASEMDPDFADAFNAVALVAYELKDYSAAASAAEKLLQFQPDNVDVMYTAYISELMIRDFERAIPAARRLAKAKPEFVTEQMMQHAQVMFDKNQNSASRALLEIIIETAPDFAPAYFQLGLTCNAMAATDCARSAFERFLELAPDDANAETARSLLDYVDQ